MSSEGLVPAPQNALPSVSRRHFLVTAGIVLGAATVANTVPAVLEGPRLESPDTSPPTPNTPPLQPDKPAPKPFEPNEGSYANTILRTLLVNVGNVAVGAVVEKKLGLRLGNAHYTQRGKGNEKASSADFARTAAMPRRKWYANMSWFTLGAPLVEEALFRALPSAQVDGRSGPGNAWKTGAATATAFAAAHAYSHRKKRATLPLPQFATGLFNWWLMRNRGYKHAVLSHVTTNTLAALPQVVGYEYAKRQAGIDPDAT